MFCGYVSQRNLLMFYGYAIHELFNKVEEMND